MTFGSEGVDNVDGVMPFIKPEHVGDLSSFVNGEEDMFRGWGALSRDVDMKASLGIDDISSVDWEGSVGVESLLSDMEDLGVVKEVGRRNNLDVLDGRLGGEGYFCCFFLSRTDLVLAVASTMAESSASIIMAASVQALNSLSFNSPSNLFWDG